MDRRVFAVMQRLREQEMLSLDNLQAMNYKPAYQSKRKISIEELAQEVGLSETRLRALFKSELGLTPRQFAKKVRMEGAALLVINTHWKVTEIAAALGVDDDSHFVRDFKEAHGRTPKEYRKLHQGAEANSNQVI